MNRMPNYCPRDKCDWTSPDGKCHFPTNNCIHKAERDAAHHRLVVAKEAQTLSRLRQTLGTASAAGLRQHNNGRWSASISTGETGRGKRAEQHFLGTYDTIQEAAAVRKLAELHRENGDLDQWVESRKGAGI